MNGQRLDRPITYALFTDSKSAIAIINATMLPSTQDTLTDMSILSNKQECKGCFKYLRYQERLILQMLEPRIYLKLKSMIHVRVAS